MGKEWKTEAKPEVKTEAAPNVPVAVADEAPVQAVPATPSVSSAVNIDLNDLVALITKSVRQELTAHNQGGLLDDDGNMEILGSAIAAGISKAQRRRLSLGEYITQPNRMQFHPDPSKRVQPRPGFNYFQGGTWINPDLTTDVEMALLNRLTHSGFYLDRVVEVVFMPLSATDTNVIVRWNAKLPDQRNEFARVARNFLDALEQIVKIQEQEDQDEADMQALRKEMRAKAHGAADRAGSYSGEDFRAAERQGRKPWERG